MAVCSVSRDSDDAIALGDLDPHALPRQRVVLAGLDLDSLLGREDERGEKEEAAQWIAIRVTKKEPPQTPSGRDAASGGTH